MSDPLSLPRAIDHLVLPIVDLDTSRERLGRLGFTVAADARHPFGTENACVFFSDDTYLEPLAVGSRKTVLRRRVRAMCSLRATRHSDFAAGRDCPPSWSRPRVRQPMMRITGSRG